MSRYFHFFSIKREDLFLKLFLWASFFSQWKPWSQLLRPELNWFSGFCICDTLVVNKQQMPLRDKGILLAWPVTLPEEIKEIQFASVIIDFSPCQSTRLIANISVTQFQTKKISRIQVSDCFLVDCAISLGACHPWQVLNLNHNHNGSTVSQFYVDEVSEEERNNIMSTWCDRKVPKK